MPTSSPPTGTGASHGSLQRSDYLAMAPLSRETATVHGTGAAEPPAYFNGLLFNYRAVRCVSMFLSHSLTNANPDAPVPPCAPGISCSRPYRTAKGAVS